MRPLLVFLACAVGLHAATGNVVYTGTFFSTGAINGTDVAANTVDGNFATGWVATSAAGSTVGFDFGAPTTITALRIAYGPSPWMPDTVGLQNSTIQTSPDNNTWTTIYTFPLHPMVPRGRFLEIPLTTAARRYYQIVSAWHGSIGEMEWIGNAGEAASGSRPVEPVITPGAGVFLGGSALITMTSLTTSAAMHYTVDGSTPTCASTLYSGPVTLTVGAATTVKAVACDASLTVAASMAKTSGVFRNYQIKPGDLWYDTDGNLGSFGDGEIRKVGNYWYKISPWTEKANGCGPGTADMCSGDGLYFYRTTDLLNWTKVKQLFTPSSWGFSIRPHMLYNASTTTLVLWAGCYTMPSNASNRGCIWTADTHGNTQAAMEGPWTLVNQTMNPDGLGQHDFNLFLDDDGVSAYIVYVGGDQNSEYISKLSADYLSTVNGPTGTCASPCLHYNIGGPVHEAPVLFKRGSTYFIFNSAGNYYDSNLTFDVHWETNTGATPNFNGWGALTSFFASDPIGTVNNGQPTSVLDLGGGNLMLQLDHWVATDLASSTRVWLMLTFPTATTLAPPSPLPTVWNLPSLGHGLFPLPSAIGQ